MNDLETSVREILGKDLSDTHWGLRLIIAAAAYENGFFTEQDEDDAAAWPLCACGMMYGRVPFARDERFLAPSDPILNACGCNFSSAVMEGNVFRAAEIMVMIEKRAAELTKP